MYQSVQKIGVLVNKLLKDFNIPAPPVNPYHIAQNLEIDIEEGDFGSNISGCLVSKNGKTIIGINKTDSELRKRFTIAHEIGHYILKHSRDGLFVDRYGSDFSVNFRDENTSTGDVQQEREANAFAAALLMPKHMLQEELIKMQKPFLDLSDEGNNDLIQQMAKKFKVSQSAMTFRIMNLKLFPNY